MSTVDHGDGEPASGRSVAVDSSKDDAPPGGEGLSLPDEADGRDEADVTPRGGLPAADPDDEVTTPRAPASETRLTPRGDAAGRLTPAHSGGMDDHPDDHRNDMAEMAWRLAEAERRAVRR